MRRLWRDCYGRPGRPLLGKIQQLRIVFGQLAVRFEDVLDVKRSDSEDAARLWERRDRALRKLSKEIPLLHLLPWEEKRRRDSEGREGSEIEN